MQLELTRVIQTCHGCPSQWDAWDVDGNYYYLRYRWGRGTVDAGVPGGREVAAFRLGDGLDGVISLEEFARLANLRVAENAEVYQ